MSRNMKMAMDLFFTIIKLRLLELGGDTTDIDKDRFVYGERNEAHWLAGMQIVGTIPIALDNNILLCQYKGESYFITTGYKDGIPPHGFLPIELNAGIFVAVVSELELRLLNSITNIEIENYILSQFVGQHGYKGHELVDLVRFFPSIEVYKIDSYEYPLLNLEQLASIFLSNNRQYLLLPFSSDTIDNLYIVASTNSTLLKYENILQALISSQFKFCFLDLYRCLELLYQVVYIDSAYSMLRVGNPKIELLSVIDSELKWKPREGASLSKIFSMTPEPHLKDIITIVAQVSGVTSKEKASEWVYDLRCRIVHMKAIHSKVDIVNKDWDKLIYGMCTLIKYWYEKYDRF